MKMNIGIDMMGGDYAPAEAVKGIELFLQQSSDTGITLTLIGNQSLVTEQLNEKHLSSNNVVIVDAPDVIGMHEHPTKALKEKTKS